MKRLRFIVVALLAGSALALELAWPSPAAAVMSAVNCHGFVRNDSRPAGLKCTATDNECPTTVTATWDTMADKGQIFAVLDGSLFPPWKFDFTSVRAKIMNFPMFTIKWTITETKATLTFVGIFDGGGQCHMSLKSTAMPATLGTLICDCH